METATERPLGRSCQRNIRPARGYTAGVRQQRIGRDIGNLLVFVRRLTAEIGKRVPDVHLGACERLLVRPVWSKWETCQESSPAHVHDSSLNESGSYEPPRKEVYRMRMDGMWAHMYRYMSGQKRGILREVWE